MSESVEQLSFGWYIDEELLVLEYLMGPGYNVIKAIKALRQSRFDRGLEYSLREAKFFVDAVITKYGYKA